MKSLVGSSSNIRAMVVDLSSRDDVAKAAQLITKECGKDGLSALVNVAGFVSFSPLECVSEKEAANLFEVMFWAPFHLTQMLLPSLKASAGQSGKNAKVLNILSRAALNADPWVGMYSAAKAALLSVTDTQYLEMKSIGIDSVAVIPGMMRTPFMEQNANTIRKGLANLPEEAKAEYGARLEKLAKMSEGSAKSVSMGLDPSKAAKEIFRIVNKKDPASRLYLGGDTKFFLFLNHFTPRTFRIWMARKIFGLSA